MTGLMLAVSDALQNLITMIGNVIGSLLDSNGSLKDLLPLFAIGIAIAVFGYAIRAIKNIVWGA